MDFGSTKLNQDIATISFQFSIRAIYHVRFNYIAFSKRQKQVFFFVGKANLNHYISFLDIVEHCRLKHDKYEKFVDTH